MDVKIVKMIERAKKYILETKRLIAVTMCIDKTPEYFADGFTDNITDINTRNILRAEIIKIIKSLDIAKCVREEVADIIADNEETISKWFYMFDSIDEAVDEFSSNLIAAVGFTSYIAREIVREEIRKEFEKYRDASEEEQLVYSKYFSETRLADIKMSEVVADAKKLGVDASGSKDKIVRRIIKSAKYIKNIKTSSVYVCDSCHSVINEHTADMKCPKCIVGKLRKYDIDRLLENESDLDNINTILYVTAKELRDLDDIVSIENEDFNIQIVARPFTKRGAVRVNRLPGYDYIYDFEWSSNAECDCRIYQMEGSKMTLIADTTFNFIINGDDTMPVFKDKQGNTLSIKYKSTDIFYVKVQESKVKDAIVGILLSSFISITLGFNYRVLTSKEKEEVSIDKTHQVNRSSINKGKANSRDRKISRRVIYLAGITLYTYDSKLVSSVRSHRVITLSAYGVTGHPRRRPKSGGYTWIEAYPRGKDRDKWKDRVDELLNMRKVEVRGDKKNYTTDKIEDIWRK